MISPHNRVCSTLRRFLPLFLILYFLLLTVLLLKVPTDIAPNIRNPSSLLSNAAELSSHHVSSHSRDVDTSHPLSNNSKILQKTTQKVTAISGNDQFKLREPRPISIPALTNVTSGSFYAVKNDVFIYSAYYDDRKKDSFIRLLTLTKQIASKSSMFCHFKDEIYTVTRKALRYELCENHNKLFGGYMFSCEVPEFLNSSVSHVATVSYGKSQQRFIIPLKHIRPPTSKLEFLDSYVGDKTPQNVIANGFNSHISGRKNTLQNVPLDSHFGETTNSTNGKNSTYLSFAVCVPPLFGDISAHRLIEFVELTLLLGADHIFFYKYDISDDIQTILSYYVSREVATVTPWELPRDVTPEKVWYNGQLLAHNDCLYRSMPHFDLVAFNDIDEYIIPHDNESFTWSQVFPGLVTNSTCGLSFQSAFYDPGIEDMNDSELLTPKLMEKTKNFSKIRSKVMLVPWRVFEVGIHHISKQNKENWTVRRIAPSTAYLHHYRQCDGYDIVCSVVEMEDLVGNRYLKGLKRNYDTAIAIIVPRMNLTTVKYRPYW